MSDTIAPTLHLHPLPLVDIHRETWLHHSADAMRERVLDAVMDATGDWQDAADHAPSRWACAFPPGTRPKPPGVGGSVTIGLCIFGESVRDGATELMVSPLLDDPVQVLATQAHELLHHYMGHKAGHGPVFAAAAKALGLAGKPTATYAGPEFVDFAHDILHTVGHYPHASVNLMGRPKQGTRQILVKCPQDPRCIDMPIRITRKWLDEGMAPLCPCCSEAMTETE